MPGKDRVFFNGCCYGLPTGSEFGVYSTVDQELRHLLIIYSCLNFILAIFLLWLSERRVFKGQVFIVYLIGYCIYRFIIEYFRFSLIHWGPFTLGQVSTLIVLLIALALYVGMRIMNNNNIYIKRSRHR